MVCLLALVALWAESQPTSWALHVTFLGVVSPLAAYVQQSLIMCTSTGWRRSSPLEWATLSSPCEKIATLATLFDSILCRLSPTSLPEVVRQSRESHCSKVSQKSGKKSGKKVEAIRQKCYDKSVKKVSRQQNREISPGKWSLSQCTSYHDDRRFSTTRPLLCPTRFQDTLI